MTCPKCGCEIDEMADCCPGCLAAVDRRKASTMALLGLRYESEPKPTPADAEPQINPEWGRGSAARNADNERLKQLWTEQRSELLKLRIEIQKTAGALKGVMSCVDAILKEMSLGQYNDLSPQTRIMIETQMAKGRTCLIPH